MPPEIQTKNILLTKWWLSINIWYYQFKEEKMPVRVYIEINIKNGFWLTFRMLISLKLLISFKSSDARLTVLKCIC